MTQLSRAGFLRSVRGAQGGYRLARRPENYTTGEILRITEGDLAPIACLSSETTCCPRESECATLDFWKELHKIINDYVDHVTLDQLVARHRVKMGGDYSI